MSRGYGTLWGVDGNDRLTGLTFTVPTLFSTWQWTYRHAATVHATGRIWDHTGVVLQNLDAATAYCIGNQPGAVMYFQWTRPAADMWVGLGTTVDTSSSANDPTVYQDGIKLTVAGGGITQVNADAAWGVGSAAMLLGNRSAGGRNWGGMLYGTAAWNVTLSDDEFSDLQRGIPANRIRPESMLYFYPLGRDVQDLNPGGAPLIVTAGTSVMPDPPMVWRPIRRHIKFAAAAAATGNPWHYYNQQRAA